MNRQASNSHRAKAKQANSDLSESFRGADRFSKNHAVKNTVKTNPADYYLTNDSAKKAGMKGVGGGGKSAANN